MRGPLSLPGTAHSCKWVQYAEPPTLQLYLVSWLGPGWLNQGLLNKQPWIASHKAQRRSWKERREALGLHLSAQGLGGHLEARRGGEGAAWL